MTTIKDTSKIMSQQVLSWAKIIKMQHSHKAMLESLMESKGFDMIRRSKQGTENDQIALKHSIQSLRTNMRKHKYCGTSHQPEQCLAYGKTCGN